MGSGGGGNKRVVDADAAVSTTEHIEQRPAVGAGHRHDERDPSPAAGDHNRLAVLGVIQQQRTSGRSRTPTSRAYPQTSCIRESDDAVVPRAVARAEAGAAEARRLDVAHRPLDDDGMLEVLAPYAPHRQRAVRYIEASGFRRPRFGPRYSPRDYRVI